MRNLSINKLSALAALVLILMTTSEISTAQSVSGPKVPCVGIPCEGQEIQPWPETGAWYNPSESGSGFTIEMQNGRMLAYYFGYDDKGQPTWWQFVDELESSENPGVVWVAEGMPGRFTGGNCFGCPYSPPDSPEQLESVRFEFLQRANMRLTLPDGSQQYMVPITYGSPERAFFPDYTDYRLPTFKPPGFPDTNSSATWYFIFDETPAGEPRGPWGLDFFPLSIGNPNFFPEGRWDRPGPVLIYRVVWNYSPLSGIGFGDIFCELRDVDGESLPGCTFEAGNDEIYDIPLGNFTDSRIQGVTQDGKRFEAFRPNLD